MTRSELREWWLESDNPIVCKMKDDTYALLVLGPSDSAIENDNWKFGFQVHGEPDVRWRQAEQLSRVGNVLLEI